MNKDKNIEWVLFATLQNGEGVTIHQKAWYSTTAIRFAEAKYGNFKSVIALKKEQWDNFKVAN